MINKRNRRLFYLPVLTVGLIFFIIWSILNTLFAPSDRVILSKAFDDSGQEFVRVLNMSNVKKNQSLFLNLAITTIGIRVIFQPPDIIFFESIPYEYMLNKETKTTCKCLLASYKKKLPTRLIYILGKEYDLFLENDLIIDSSFFVEETFVRENDLIIQKQLDSEYKLADVALSPGLNSLYWEKKLLVSFTYDEIIRASRQSSSSNLDCEIDKGSIVMEIHSVCFEYLVQGPFIPNTEYNIRVDYTSISRDLFGKNILYLRRTDDNNVLYDSRNDFVKKSSALPFGLSGLLNHESVSIIELKTLPTYTTKSVLFGLNITDHELIKQLDKISLYTRFEIPVKDILVK